MYYTIYTITIEKSQGKNQENHGNSRDFIKQLVLNSHFSPKFGHFAPILFFAGFEIGGSWLI